MLPDCIELRLAPSDIRVLIDALAHYLSLAATANATALEHVRHLRRELVAAVYVQGDGETDPLADTAADWDDDDDGQPSDLQEHEDFAHDDDLAQGYDLDGGEW